MFSPVQHNMLHSLYEKYDINKVNVKESFILHGNRNIAKLNSNIRSTDSTQNCSKVGNHPGLLNNSFHDFHHLGSIILAYGIKINHSRLLVVRTPLKCAAFTFFHVC